MGPSSTKAKRWSVPLSGLGVIGVIMTMTLFGAASAQAASDHTISGSTFSSSEAWYYSTNVRTKEGAGNITARFSERPKLGNGNSDLLKFAVVEVNSNVLIPGASIQYFDSSTSRTLATNVPNAKTFRNAYARYTTCNNCNHNFAGVERY
jgi:hypothetical protein